MKKKLILSLSAVAAAATVVCAHLPSMYDARFQIDRERERLSNSPKTRATYSNKGTWNEATSYSGNYANFEGDTVSYGTWNGKTLWWWTKFWTKGDKPGETGSEGGTSPWVLVNSLSATGNGKVNYQWKGWDGNSPSESAPFVATWRNGAKGAYSMTHDDIGSMPFNNSVTPAYLLGREPKYEQIKQSWGVYVDMMDDSEWDLALKMVTDGHEMFNHSWDHTSAADQWQWFYPTTVVPSHDPSIPPAIRGLTVVGTWGNASQAGLAWPVPATVDFESELVTVKATPYWTAVAPSTEPVGGDACGGESGTGCPRLVIEPVVTAKAGTETITLPSGKKAYVKYTKKSNLLDDPDLDYSRADIVNEGKIAATGVTWYDIAQLTQYGNGWTHQYVAADQGSPGFVAKIMCYSAWDATDMQRNMKQANDKINEKIYDRIENPGKYFRVGKKSEYFGYPMDAYSETSHKKLEDYGIPAARGGAKSGVPMPGDFFHPYRIDFDAFYIEKSDWNPSKQGAGYVYPDNAHVRLGLNEMIDKIIETKGYMVREFHAVADIAEGAWYNNEHNSMWPINSPAKEMGGWWGGITKFQLRAHYDYLSQKIDAKELVVYTASEAVTYRMTANAVSGANLSGTTLTATLNNSNDPGNMYYDEVSFIVQIDATELNVEYTGGKGNPRLAPKNLGNGYWSVNFNPYVSTSVNLIPGQAFEDPIVVTPGFDPDDVDIPGPGDDCDPFDPNCNGSAIFNVKDKKTGVLAFTGIRNGQINLRLNAGNYSVELYNLQGRMVGKQNISAINGVNATGLRTDNLSKGIFILNVKQAGASLLQHKIMIK
ncbi:MAG: T9SS type A sorting domain-containing protein [Chitinispirillales bacterium]|jgi:hypothetical protein|nr:T9SS type A sorting domain-containing protein [Chitinispirillales bacterium]